MAFQPIEKRIAEAELGLMQCVLNSDGELVLQFRRPPTNVLIPFTLVPLCFLALAFIPEMATWGLPAAGTSLVFLVGYAWWWWQQGRNPTPHMVIDKDGIELKKSKRRIPWDEFESLKLEYHQGRRGRYAFLYAKTKWGEIRISPWYEQRPNYIESLQAHLEEWIAQTGYTHTASA